VRAGARKPRRADEALAGISARARAVASGDRHEIGVQVMLDNVSRIELVSVASGFLAEDDADSRGRARLAVPCVTSEDRKLSGLLWRKPWAWRALLPGPSSVLREVLLDLLHFLGSLRKRGKRRVGRFVSPTRNRLLSFGRG